MEESSRPKILRSYRQNSHELLLIWFRCEVNTKTVIFLWICDLGTCLVSFPLSSQYIIKLVSDLCVFNFRSKTFLTAKMPNIVYDVKLDFKDVLLRPKRSTLKSRADVDLYREITFRNSKQTYNGIPIMASNMDTVGTFEMAKTLAKVFRRHIFSCVHSHWCLIRTYRYRVTHKSFRKWSSVHSQTMSVSDYIRDCSTAASPACTSSTHPRNTRSSPGRIPLPSRLANRLTVV